MIIEELFSQYNKNKFSFLLLVKEGIDRTTYDFLYEKLSEKINVVPLRGNKYSEEDRDFAIEKADFVVTGIGETLNICVGKKKPTICDVSSNTLEKEYPTFVDFFDPFRNEAIKSYYQDKHLDLLLNEIYKQLDRHKIDYVNYL